MVPKTKIAGLVMAVMALSAPLVYADNGPGDGKACPIAKGGDWHKGHEGHMLAKVLGLTEDQTKQVTEAQEKNKEAMKAIFGQMKTVKEAFDAEIVKATPDMNKVNDLQNQFKTIQGQMLDNHLNSLLAIKKVLTPEQFAGYMALKKEHQLKMMHKHHGQFGHKDFGRGGDGDKHWGDKPDEGDQD